MNDIVNSHNVDSCIKKAKTENDYFQLFLYYKEIRQLKEAEKYLEKAVELAPNNLNYKLLLSVISLGTENYVQGWKMYEERLALDSYVKRNLPRWKGEENKYKKIIVFSEQGYGDCFMYGRFLYLLKKHFQYVCFSASKELLNVLTPKVLQIDQTTNEINPAEFDCYCDLGSLPFLLKLNNEKALNKNWDYLKRLSTSTNEEFKAGICLHGRLTTDYERTRAIDLKLIQPLIENKKIHCVSLYQPQQNNALYDSWKQKGELEDPPYIFDDFNLTADIINKLDLIITSDTSIAHLSGSMGKKTYLLLPRKTDWRWKISGESSYWYDSMTIIRQENQGEWESVRKTLFYKIKEEFLDRNHRKISFLDRFKQIIAKN